MTVYISYPEALHKALAPQQPFQDFLLTYSAMNVELLGVELSRAQRRYQSATRLRLSPGGETELTNWIWPDTKQVQSLLQRRVMQAVVDPDGHSHEAPVEIHADANAGGRYQRRASAVPGGIRESAGRGLPAEPGMG